MKEETKRLLSIWIGVHPESDHPADIERFYELIFNCLKNNTIISSSDIYIEVKNQKKWSEEYATIFVDKYSSFFYHISGFIDYLKEKQRVNIYNIL